MNADNVVPLSESYASVEKEINKSDLHDELASGTLLMHGQYKITDFLNRGGFGITYLASDSLGRPVVIKECFPSELCYRSENRVIARSRKVQHHLSSVIRGFVREARNLAALEHPNIVGVHHVFEDNGTAYLAIDFIDGLDLLDIIDDDTKRLHPDQVVNITTKLLGAIGFVHSNKILHRDISPDNILINTDGEPVLIDFGAATEDATRNDRNLSTLRVVKDGYSPQEFYVVGAEQGPWSDLFSFGASLFHLIDGKVPVSCQTRLSSIANDNIDPYVPLAGRIKGYPPGFLEAIDKSLRVLPKHRIQSAEEWLGILSSEDADVDKELREAVSELRFRRSSQGASIGFAADAGGRKAMGRVPLMAGAAAMVTLIGAGAYVATRPGEPVAVSTEVVELSAPVLSASIVEAQTAISPEFMFVAAGDPDASVLLPTLILPVSQTVELGEFAAPELPTQAALQVSAPPKPEPLASPIDQNGISVAVWNVAMPFDAALEKVRNANIATITQIHERNLSANDTWIAEGVEIHIVNDNRLADGAQVETHVLNSLTLDPDGMTRASVMYKDPETKRFERALLSVPVVRDVWLHDGTQLQVRMIGANWISEVIATGSMPGNELKAGDLLSREAFTGIELNDALSLEQVFDRAARSNFDSVSFAVTRNGKAATATLLLREGSG